MAKTEKYSWEFQNVGGTSRVKIRKGADIANLDKLDKKLWTVLSCPVNGLEIDNASLAYIDADGDGKIRVEVGSVHHPMTPEHHIAFIYVETDNGGIRVDLKDTPVADIYVGAANVTAVYEYCNLHGLWANFL